MKVVIDPKGFQYLYIDETLKEIINSNSSVINNY